MIIRLKDAVKLIGVTIITCCAVFVSTLFMNYNIDIVKIKDLIDSDKIMAFYDAQVLNGKVSCAVSGLCLLLTSVVMLCFYIKHYIDIHKKDLGILKALGYSKFKIAKNFAVFSLSVFTGTTLGLCSAFALLPKFYEVMNEDKILPEIPMHFNFILFLYLVILPTLVFGLLAVGYSYFRLKCSALELLKGKSESAMKKKKSRKQHETEITFLQELKKSTVRNRFILIFFIAFASFCYSAMTQMSMSMKDLASPMMAAIIVIIGFILAFTTLFLAVTTVINANTKQISIMKVFGYSFRECSDAILNGYRPIAYIGFAIGTVYQYVLLKIMVGVFSTTMESIPEYCFDVKAFIIVLISFVFIYEAIMYIYSARIKKISVKEVMSE
ncbi:MAG: FtsX-like permease family protein [Oscillospiraceae bacterium]|nr:FtsX-like permease family protein [Oscillospiraceae bacterium]